ncbi:MAG: hypothetical protein QG599_3025 [Pseudomonadota bacterium]|nr:hypothetical protein [Pseudomonadota bacterium]
MSFARMIPIWSAPFISSMPKGTLLRVVTVMDITPFQIGLSPVVEQAVPHAVTEIVRLLKPQASV